MGFQHRSKTNAAKATYIQARSSERNYGNDTSYLRSLTQ